MLSMDNEIITCNSTKSNDVKEIEKAIEKLKLQEKRLVDLYLSSNLDVKTINYKNDVIKKEIDKLNKKKISLDPDNSLQDYTVELIKKLDCIEENETGNLRLYHDEAKREPREHEKRFFIIFEKRSSRILYSSLKILLSVFKCGESSRRFLLFRCSPIVTASDHDKHFTPMLLFTRSLLFTTFTLLPFVSTIFKMIAKI